MRVVESKLQFKMCEVLSAQLKAYFLQHPCRTRCPAEEAADRRHATSGTGHPVAITQESSRHQAADLPGDQGVPQVEACTVNFGKLKIAP